MFAYLFGITEHVVLRIFSNNSLVATSVYLCKRSNLGQEGDIFRLFSPKSILFYGKLLQKARLRNWCFPRD